MCKKLFLFLLLVLFSIAAVHAQALTAIPNPTELEYGDSYGGEEPLTPVNYNGKMYFTYYNSNSIAWILTEWNGSTMSQVSLPAGYTFQKIQPFVFNGNLYLGLFDAAYKSFLAKFNGAAFTIISNASTSDQGYGGMPVVFNNELYISYINSNYKSQLAKYNSAGNSLNLINNISTTDFGYTGNPIIFNSELYIRYQAGSKYYLAKYSGTGTSLTLINNPTASEGYFGYPIVFNNELYVSYQTFNKKQLAKYNGIGSTLTLINNANTSDFGIVLDPIIFNNEIYMYYVNSNAKNQLAKYSGTGNSLTLIDNANATDRGYGGSPIVFNNELFIQYIDVNNKYYLAKYSGSGNTLSYISNANTLDLGYWSYPIVFNNELYIRYVSSSNAVLAKYNSTGNSLTYLPNPDPQDIGYAGLPLAFNNALYVAYLDESSKYHLAKFNGSTLNVYDNVDGGRGYINGPSIYNNQILLKYENENGGYQLAFIQEQICTTTTDTIKASICNGSSYTFNGVALTAVGYYNDTLVNAGGCDSIVTLNLSVNQLTSSDTTASLCNSFTWHDSTYKASGDYIWHTTNAMGCDSTRTLHLTIWSVTSTVSQTNVTCYGTATGSIEVNPTNGVSPYTYRIGTMGSFVPSKNFNNLKAGKYRVTILDANGCAGVTNQLTITQPIAITGTTSVTNATCYGSTNGSIAVTPSTGMAPYMYKLGITGIYGTSNVFSNLKAGAYRVYIKDANSCEGNAVATITQPNRVSASYSKTDETCPNAKNGSVTAICSGANAPYTYRFGSIGSFGANNTFSNLKTGTYRIYVNDANNCSVYSILTKVGQTSPTCSTPSRIVTANQVIAEAQQGLSVLLTPNPSNSYFTLRVKATTQEAVQLKVIDINGRSLFTTKGLPEQAFKFGESFAPGVYMIEVRQGDEVKTVKAVKIK